MAAINLNPISFTTQTWGQTTVWKESAGCRVASHYVDAHQQLTGDHYSATDKILTVMDGDGEVIIDGKKWKATKGDIIHMPAKSLHAIHGGSRGISVMEVQIAPPPKAA